MKNKKVKVKSNNEIYKVDFIVNGKIYEIGRIDFNKRYWKHKVIKSPFMIVNYSEVDRNCSKVYRNEFLKNKESYTFFLIYKINEKGEKVFMDREYYTGVAWDLFDYIGWYIFNKGKVGWKHISAVGKLFYQDNE